MKNKILKSASLILIAALVLAGCWIRQNNPAPTQSPSSSQSSNIPGSGGVVSGNKKTDYTFTPDSSTIWRFDVTQGSDGGATLKVYDPDGDCIRDSQFKSVGNLQQDPAWVYMQEGFTYKISMDVWAFPTVRTKNSYSLTISPAETISGEGGEVHVDSAARYKFVPNRSGLWIFSTHVSSEDCEPMVSIWDVIKKEEIGDNNNYEVGGNLDSMTLELVADTIYSVSVSFRSNKTGNYTLAISPADIWIAATPMDVAQ